MQKESDCFLPSSTTDSVKVILMSPDWAKPHRSMAKPGKKYVTVSGKEYPLSILCARIAKLTGAKKPVKYVHTHGGGGQFKAGKRTVAIHDGTRISATSDRSVLEISDPPETPIQKPKTPEEPYVPEYEQARKDLLKERVEERGEINEYMDNMLGRYEYVKAAKYIDGILMLDPGNVCAISRRCMILQLFGRDKEALDEIKAATQRIPGDDSLVWKLHEIQSMQRLDEDALKSIDEYIQLDDDDWDGKDRRLDTLIRLGRFQEVLDYVETVMSAKLQELANEYGMDVKVLYERICWHEPVGPARPSAMYRYEEFSNDMQYGIIILFGAKALALSGMGRHKEALKIIDRAIIIEGWDGLTYPQYIRARIMEDMGCKAEALEYYERYPASRYEYINNHRGKLLVGAGRHEDACRYFELSAVSPFWGKSEGAELAASSHVMLGRFGTAVRFADRALEIYPGSKKAMAIKAKSLYKLGDYAKAAECADRVPDNDWQEVCEPGLKEEILANKDA